MSNNSPRISVTSDDNANSQIDSGSLALRKRHSPNTVNSTKEDSTTISESAAFSKLRKVSASTSKAGNHENDANQTAPDKPGSSKNVDLNASKASSTTGVLKSGGISTTKTRYAAELKDLTDYFPNQLSSDGRMTRSRAKAVELSRNKNTSTNSGATTAGSSTSVVVSAKSDAVYLSASSQTKTSSQQQHSQVVKPVVVTSGVSASTFATVGSSRNELNYGNANISQNTISQNQGKTSTSASSSTTATVGTSASTSAGVLPLRNELNYLGTNVQPNSILQHHIKTSSGISASTASLSSRNDLNYLAGNIQSNTISQQHVNRATSFLGSLVPRMQHLLSGTAGTGITINSTNPGIANANLFNQHNSLNNRMAHLLEGLRSPNEISQSVAVSDLSELFLLGNEETLPNVPVREIIQALIQLLQKDHNIELMLTAARCLTNMQEALPRSHPIIVEAIPILLQKLKRIEYIDVAEQSLTILEVMSRRSARNILTAGGIADTISNVDFFPLPSQRLIFQIASNCAAYIGNAEFGLIKDCLSDLTLRFGFVEDKRCVESICTFFNRIIDNLRNFPDRLREIAGQNHEFLKNIQSLMMVQPPTIGTSILLNLFRSCRYMGAKCGDLAVSMIQMGYGRTILFLLIGVEKNDGTETIAVDVNTRPAQYILEIIQLIGELMPAIPNSDAYELSKLFNLYSGTGSNVGVNYYSAPGNTNEVFTQNYEREKLKKDHNEAYVEIIGMLFPLMVDIGTATTCSYLRFEILRVMMRMINAVESEKDLRKILSDVPLAIYISSTLSTCKKNYSILVLVLELVAVLLDKIPTLYTPLFESEGVFYAINLLIKKASSSSDSFRDAFKAAISTIKDGPSATPTYTPSNLQFTYTSVIANNTSYSGSPVVSTAMPPLSSSASPSINRQNLSLSSYLAVAAAAAHFSISGSQSATDTTASAFPSSSSSSSSSAARTRPINVYNTVRHNLGSGSSAAAAAAAAASSSGLSTSYSALHQRMDPLSVISSMQSQQQQQQQQALAPFPAGAPGTISSMADQLSLALSSHIRQQRSVVTPMLNQQFPASMLDSINYLNSRNAAATALPPALHHPNEHPSCIGPMTSALSHLQPQYINPLNSVIGANPLSMNNNMISDMFLPLSGNPAQSLPNLALNTNIIYPNSAMLPNPMGYGSDAAAVAAAAAAANFVSAEPSLNSVNFSTFGLDPATAASIQAQALSAVVSNVANSSIPVLSSAAMPATSMASKSAASMMSGVLSRSEPLSSSAALPNPASFAQTSGAPSTLVLRNCIQERLQEFVSLEAQRIISTYASDQKNNAGDKLGKNTVMTKMKQLADMFKTKNKDIGLEPLNELKNVLMNFEISVFHFNHSGIASSLTRYLVDSTSDYVPERATRMRRFTSVFMAIDAKTLQTLNYSRIDGSLIAFERLVSKIIHSIGQLEQFTVKLTNLSGIGQGVGGATTYLRGAQAMRFFQSHQIRLHLQKHPACRQLREWRHGRGSIKVDPFASVSSIERYLIERGVGRTLAGGANIAGGEDSSDNDDASDDDQVELSDSNELNLETNDWGQRRVGIFNDKIELYMGETKLASDLSILQAIRQCSYAHDDETQETIPSSMWMSAHQIFYRAALSTPHTNASVITTLASQIASTSAGSSTITASSSAANVAGPSTSESVGTTINASLASEQMSSLTNLRRRDNKTRASPIIASSVGQSVPLPSSPDRKIAKVSQPNKKFSTSITKGHVVFKDGNVPRRRNALDEYINSTNSQLSTSLNNDACIGCLMLLKALYGLNYYWWALFENDKHVIIPSYSPVLQAKVFYSSKLTSKVTRQLSDFLSVAIQQIPKWTLELVKTFSFVFPFPTRRNFFYCTTFGRDRALMYLVNEGSGDFHDSNDSTSRLMPRLERRKISVDRNNLLRDAQHCFSQLGSSKAMLEVVFEGEAGTGFGPTLEFYTTISRELQRDSLKMWHGKGQKDETDTSEDNVYTMTENGVYPSLHRPSTSKLMQSRLKKFEFFGRLIAQALMDTRMLDVPMSPLFFKWLTDREDTVGLDDFEILEPQMFNSLQSLFKLDAESFADLETYFMLPGENSFELIKNGKNIPLKKENLKKFLELILFWRVIEGVRPEMEAVRRGFRMVINTDSLKIFFPDEIEQLFCGCSEKHDDKIWSKATMQQAFRPDHGYSHDSAQIGYLVDMLHSFSNENRRKFLQFVTGSPRLPVGGFRALNPQLTVVRKTASSELELPSAMTCYNYLKIPPYETYATFVERFNVALQFIYSFHLT